MNLDAFPKNIVKTVRYIKQEASDQQVLQLEKLLKETIDYRLNMQNRKSENLSERKKMSL